MDVRVGPWKLSEKTFFLEKTLESPLDCKEIKPVNSNGNQSWIFIGSTDAEALILWPPDVKNWLIGKDPDAGKDWRQEEKGMKEDEMVGWHHHLNGHEFELALGVDDGQGGLTCCSPGGCKELDTTEWLNNNKLPQGQPLCPGACQIIQISHLTGSPGNLTNPALTVYKLISMSPAYSYSCPWIYLLYVALPGSLLWFGAATNSFAFHLYECQYVLLILPAKKKNKTLKLIK